MRRTGYVADATQFIRGLSPLHDSGTGSSLGTYGNFEIMPQIGCDFNTCPTRYEDRLRLRKNNTDGIHDPVFKPYVCPLTRLNRCISRLLLPYAQ